MSVSIIVTNRWDNSSFLGDLATPLPAQPIASVKSITATAAPTLLHATPHSSRIHKSHRIVHRSASGSYPSRPSALEMVEERKGYLPVSSTQPPVPTASSVARQDEREMKDSIDRKHLAASNETPPPPSTSTRRVLHRAESTAKLAGISNLRHALSTARPSHRSSRSVVVASSVLQRAAKEQTPIREEHLKAAAEDSDDFGNIGLIMCDDDALSKDMKLIRALVTTNDKPVINPKKIDPFLGSANSMNSELSEIQGDERDSQKQTTSYYKDFGKTGLVAGASAFCDPWVSLALTFTTTLYGAYLSTRYNKVQADYSVDIVKRINAAFDKLQKEFQRLGESLIVAHLKAHYVILSPDMPVAFQQGLCKTNAESISKLSLAIRQNIRHVEEAMKEKISIQNEHINNDEKIKSVVSPLLAAATLIIRHSMNVAQRPNEPAPSALQEMEKYFKDKDEHYKVVAEKQKQNVTIDAQAKLIEEQRIATLKREEALKKHADEQIENARKAAEAQISKVRADTEKQLKAVTTTTDVNSELIGLQTKLLTQHAASITAQKGDAAATAAKVTQLEQQLKQQNQEAAKQQQRIESLERLVNALIAAKEADGKQLDTVANAVQKLTLHETIKANITAMTQHALESASPQHK